MAQAPGTRTKGSSGSRQPGKLSAVGSFTGFVIVAGVAVAILASVVLLPAWQRMALARADRDALAGRTEAYSNVIQYRSSAADAIKTDPLQTRNILIQSRNYRPAGEGFLPVASGQADQPVMELLATTDSPAKQINPALDRAANKVQQPKFRNILLILSGILLTLAVSIFMPTSVGAKF